MQYTENYQYRKPVIGVDVADIKDMNFNSDKTDALIHNTQISLAPAYDLNEIYNTGNVVMYETLMYKCKADNVTGAWDPSKWERTTAGEEGAGGGGTSVVPNPQGTPTDTLNTIRIDGTIFDIAGSGGGGGGSAFKETLLYENTGTSAGDITLSDDLSNYDMLMFVVVRTIGVGRELIELPFMTSDLTVGTHITLISYASEYINYDVTSMTLLTRTNSQSNYVEKVKGIKFGGGSGSSGGYSETSLYTYTGSTRQTTLSLSDDYTNYDAVEFTFGWNLGGADFETVNVISSSKIVSNVFVNVGGEGRYNYISRGSADDEIILATATGSWDGSSIIREIRGINY